MPNYQNGKIYTIRCRTDESKIYIGSTTMILSKRLAEHRYASYSKEKTGKRFYKDVENRDDWYIELYEEYPCENKQQLIQKEGENIRKINTFNQGNCWENTERMATRKSRKEKATQKKYHENHREERLEVNQKWMEKNKDYRKEYKKAYREANKEKIAAYRAKYFKNVECQNKDETNKKQRDNYAKRRAL